MFSHRRTTAPLLGLAAAALLAACGGGSPSLSSPAGTPPVATAGPDQAVASGATVTLDGSASAGTGALSYAWAQVSGPAVALSAPSAAVTTFASPVVAAGAAPVALAFTLTVHDAAGAAASAAVAVTVAPAPPAVVPPVAHAGADQAVASGAAVVLGGSASGGAAGATYSYAWTQVSGPPVSLLGTGTAAPTFTAPTVAAGAPPVALVFALVVGDGITGSAPSQVTVTVNPEGAAFPPPPGTPPPAPADPNPPPAGGSGSNRWEIGAAGGLYVVDPAAGEPSVQGFVVVTFGPVSSGNFIPPDGTVVTLNGVPLLRDPTLNGAWFRVDPAGPQPVAGSGGRLVLTATATVSGKLLERTLVLPCPADVAVASTPEVGAALAAGGSVRLTSPSDLTLNVGIAPMAGIVPTAILWGYDPATRALSASGGPHGIPPGPLDLSVPVAATTAPAYLMDLRWPGQWIIDGETGGFCGLAKRWTYAR